MPVPRLHDPKEFAAIMRRFHPELEPVEIPKEFRVAIVDGVVSRILVDIFALPEPENLYHAILRRFPPSMWPLVVETRPERLLAGKVE